MRKTDLQSKVERLFNKRSSLNSLWQEVSEHFYPERADFTYRRTLGTDFASNLVTSYPLLARRELSNQVGMMLRPADREWFYMEVEEGREDRDARLWLDWANATMRRAMYDRKSQFSRATAEADADWSTFGQYVMQVRLNDVADALLYRLWHLRDCVWMEDEAGEIVFFARRWKPEARDLVLKFGDKTHQDVRNQVEKHPFVEFDCLHVVLAADMLEDENPRNREFISVYLDVAHDGHVMEVTPQRSFEYVIPRWQTVSGSQYAYSPATVAALPDARLIQAMTYTLLEAGEKATNPPMVATTDVVRSDVAIYAGGITWVDRDYDEKLGEALRPLTRDYARGMPIGLEMLQDTRTMIHQAFYLNKLTLPSRAPEMTAYEVGQRIQEYIRGALPLFEPMEQESNGRMCEMTFNTLMAAGAFGSPLDMPASLRGAKIDFKYRSPLHDVIDAQKGQTFREGAALLAEAAAIDQSAVMMIDAPKALREALDGIGVPEDWMRGEEEVASRLQAQQAQQEQAQMMAALEQGSNVAANMGKANVDFAAAAAAGGGGA